MRLCAPGQGRCECIGHQTRHGTSVFVGSNRPPRHRVYAEPEGPSGKDTTEAKPGVQLNDAMLAELRAAQEEAARLRKELDAARAGGTASKDVVEVKPKRFDSVDNRETLFTMGNGKRTSWLSEADVDFFTGGGSSEAASTRAPSQEQQATVQRRLLIGGLATAGLLAFGLVPTKDLRLKPSKPLYFYLVQLLRVEDQLRECKDIIENGQWNDLRLILARVVGAPGNLQQTLFDAIALVDGSISSKAEPLAGELLEYIDAMDYNKYFDAMPSRKISGNESAEFVKFSGQALKAAQQRLSGFLALMPAEDLRAAREAVAAELAGEE